MQGLQKTCSTRTRPRCRTRTDIWISLIAFIVVYIVPAAVDLGLMLRYSRRLLAQADAEAAETREGAVAPALTPTDAMDLHTIWFVIVAVFWVGFFVLEGFDFGVGMLHAFVGRSETARRAAINTIGPWWDGNEVWLVVAGASMFAAFPVGTR